MEENWMKLVVRLLLFALLSTLTLAQPATMTRMVVKNTSPDIEEGSFASLPRTITRQGTSYARVEEAHSPKDGVHLVIIRAGAEMWQLDLTKKAGLHQGGFPTKSSVPVYTEFYPLEFGRELEFMEENEVDPETVDGLDGKPLLRYGVRDEQRGIALYVLPEARTPVRILFVDLKSGTVEMSVDYLEYERDLPFQPGLFAPPEGFTISEME